jgi:hypothetical protein
MATKPHGGQTQALIRLSPPVRFDSRRIARKSTGPITNSAPAAIPSGTNSRVGDQCAGGCFSNRPFGVKRLQTIHHHSPPRTMSGTSPDSPLLDRIPVSGIIGQ